MKKTLKFLQSDRGGFALISSLSIMVLLVMLVIGMLSLATTETKSATIDKHEMEAKANARMALMIALGELQEAMGPDRRISADSQILDSEDANGNATLVQRRNVMGAWDSLGEGLEAGTEIDPLDGTAMAPTYVRGREPRFRKWLVSGEGTDDLSYVDQAATQDAISLVAEGSLGPNIDEREHVRAEKEEVEGGAFAWWVGQENTKVRVGVEKPTSTEKQDILNDVVVAKAPNIYDLEHLNGFPKQNADY